MPTVLRLGAFRFFFFSSEKGEPAHVHIAAGECEAKIWLHSCDLAYSFGFKPHELTRLILATKEHRIQLLEAWHEYFKRNA